MIRLRFFDAGGTTAAAVGPFLQGTIRHHKGALAKASSFLSARPSVISVTTNRPHPAPVRFPRLTLGIHAERLRKDAYRGRHLSHRHRGPGKKLVRVLAIDRLVEVVVMADDSALQRDTGKHALAARVAQDTGIERRVGGRSRRAPDRPGGHARLAAHLELVFEGSVQSLLV